MVIQKIQHYFFPVMIPVIVVLLIQGIKLIIDWVKHKHFDWKNLFTTGGFPSVHSGMTSSAAMLAGLYQGFDSVLFTVTFVLMFLISFDAMNLRYETGKHAHYINDLRFDLKNVLGETNKTNLKERIGHTPLEVFGGLIFGIIFTTVLYYIVR